MKYYKDLNVDKTASEADIKKAYYNLSRRYHPDKGGDSDHFREIKAAYDVLGDSEKRKMYDKYGFLGKAPAHTFLYVASPNLPLVKGKYKLSEGTHNGHPVWRKYNHDTKSWLFLYSGNAIKRWFISQNKSIEAGLIQSEFHDDARMPEDISAWQLSWNNSLTVDYSINITCQDSDIFEVLHVSCPNISDICGRYDQFVGQQRNNRPFWKLVDGDICIYYSEQYKKWLIGGSASNIGDNPFRPDRCFAQSEESPYLCSMMPQDVTVWQRLVGSSFVNDYSIQVIVRNPNEEKETLECLKESLEKALAEERCATHREQEEMETSKRNQARLEWRLTSEQTEIEFFASEVNSVKKNIQSLDMEMESCKIARARDCKQFEQQMFQERALSVELQQEYATSRGFACELLEINAELRGELNKQQNDSEEMAIWQGVLALECNHHHFEKKSSGEDIAELRKRVGEECARFEDECSALQAHKSEALQEFTISQNLGFELRELREELKQQQKDSEARLDAKMTIWQDSLAKERNQCEWHLCERKRLEEEIYELQVSVEEEHAKLEDECMVFQEHEFDLRADLAESHMEFSAEQRKNEACLVEEMAAWQSSLEEELMQFKNWEEQLCANSLLQSEVTEMQQSISEERANAEKAMQDFAASQELPWGSMQCERQLLEKNFREKKLDEFQKRVREDLSTSYEAATAFEDVAIEPRVGMGSIEEKYSKITVDAVDVSPQKMHQFRSSAFNPDINIYDTRNGEELTRNIHIECPGVAESDVELEDLGYSVILRLSKRKLIDDCAVIPYRPIQEQYGQVTKTFSFEDGPFELREEHCSLCNGILKVALKKRPCLKFRLKKHEHSASGIGTIETKTAQRRP